MMSDAPQGNLTSRGIQELIDELREKGVNAGKEESSRLVEDAENRAAWILEQAEAEAAEIRSKAEKDAAFIRKSGADALEMAYRDIRMKLRDELSRQFARQLSKLVVQELKDPQTLKQLLVSAAARSKLPDEPARIVLPERAIGLEELRSDPSQLQGGPLIEMVSEVARELFSQGVEIGTDGRGRAGVSVSFRDGEINVDLTDQALVDLLLGHLQPRFRAILEGVVG
jgi:V/A-type H+-transporting ATPase subunit E